MDDVFSSDPLFRSLDPDGTITLSFCKTALNASQVTSLPGGLVGMILRKWKEREDLEKILTEHQMTFTEPWLIYEVGKHIVTEVIAKFLVEKTLRKKGDENKERKGWDGKGGREGEIQFVEKLDEFLQENDPVTALTKYSDLSASKAERKLCSALIHHYKGSPYDALGDLAELQSEWKIETDQLSQFIELRRARAGGLAGYWSLTEKILRGLIEDKSAIEWIKGYAVRDLAHYQIQYAWTNNASKNWKSVRETLQQAKPLLNKSGLSSRLEKTRRSLLEFQAIVDFQTHPTVASADKVAKCLDAFMRVEPTYGKIRATPLAALYLRANDPKQALAWSTRYVEDLQSTMEKGVALLVQAQAYKRLGKADEAFTAATEADSFLSPPAKLSTYIFKPPRFSRFGRWYSTVYSPTKSVFGKVVSLIPFIRGRLYGSFIVDLPKSN